MRYFESKFPSAIAGRKKRFATYAIAQCQPEGSPSGKPCWLTEWGFKFKNKVCPANDADQVELIKEMREIFQPYTADGRLRGIIYYAWIDPGENFGVYRCGALIEAGKIALSPMDSKPN